MNSASQVSGLVGAWKAAGLSKPDIAVRTANACMDWPYVWGAVGADCTPAKREYYYGRCSGEKDKENIKKSCPVLNGSQAKCSGCKWLPNGQLVLINDCQGFVKNVLSRVGLSMKGGGCTSMWKDNSNWSEKGELSKMPTDKVCLIFKAEGEKMSHVGLYCGNGLVIHCSHYVQEGPCPDRSWGWSHYAIPAGLYGDEPITKPTLRKGDSGPYVVECQQDLIWLGYDLQPYGADGKYGNKTMTAVKAFQSSHVDPDTGKKLSADGICGPRTWAALDAAVKPGDLYTVTIPHLSNAQAESLKSQYPGATKEKE